MNFAGGYGDYVFHTPRGRLKCLASFGGMLIYQIVNTGGLSVGRQAKIMI